MARFEDASCTNFGLIGSKLHATQLGPQPQHAHVISMHVAKLQTVGNCRGSMRLPAIPSLVLAIFSLLFCCTWCGTGQLVEYHVAAGA